jgi:hypothetical protein
MSPFQGQRPRAFYGQIKGSTNPYSFSSFDQMNPELGVKVAYDIPLS